MLHPRPPLSDHARRLDRVLQHSFTRFCLVGLVGLTFDVMLLAALTAWTPLPRTAAVTVAFATTYALNFGLNRAFSFHAHGHVARQLSRFVPQLALDYLLTIGAVQLLVGLGLPLLPARILAGGTNAALNYLAYRFWTFRIVDPGDQHVDGAVENGPPRSSEG